MLEKFDNKEPDRENKELLTGDSIKKRIMEFFKDVDLNKTGVSEIGPLKIETNYYGHIEEMSHIASVNGFKIAELRYIPDKNKLSPLPEGKDRTVLSCVLRGYVHGRGEAWVTYSEYEKKPPEIEIVIPSTALNLNDIVGPINKIRKDDQEWIAQLLGIKI